MPKDMIQFGAEGFFIKIEIETESEFERTISELQLGFAGGKRRVKVDNQVIASYKELMNFLRVISITEEDLLIVQGSPEHRRAFIDYALLVENPDYAHALGILKQIVLNRNALLLRCGKPEDYTVFTQQLWEQSVAIQDARQRYLTIVQDRLQLLIDQFFNGEFSLDLAYLPKKEMWSTSQAFRENHPNLYEQEVRMKRSLFGAHLDDIAFVYNAKASRAFASRGQQKLIVLLIKIAQLQLLREQCPLGTILFLLDDFITDLDDYRVGLIIKTLQNLNVQLVFTAPVHGSSASSKIVEYGGSINILSI
jgi:DNA replication and repair protein RecF